MPVFVVISVLALIDPKLLFRKLFSVADGFVGFLFVYDCIDIALGLFCCCDD